MAHARAATRMTSAQRRKITRAARKKRGTAGPSAPRDAWEICEQDLNPTTGCLHGSPYPSCPGGWDGCIKHACVVLYKTHASRAGCMSINASWNPTEDKEVLPGLGRAIKASTGDSRTIAVAARNAMNSGAITSRQRRIIHKVARQNRRRPSVGAAPQEKAAITVLAAATHAYQGAYDDHANGLYLEQAWHTGLTRKVYHTAWHEAAAGMPRQ